MTWALLLLALPATAQYIPPIPKSVSGGRALHRTHDIPLPAANQTWVRARSSHFITLSGASENRTRDVVDELETVAAALRQIDPHFAAEGDPTHMFLFARTRDGEPYFDLLVGRPKTAGAFVRNPEGEGSMLVDGSRLDADRTIIHELVHDLLAKSNTHLPVWLEEGMADYFSTATIAGDNVRITGRINDHSILLRNRPRMRVEELFEVLNGDAIAGSGFFYAESWSVVDWLMRTDAHAFYNFVNDIDHGTSSVDALNAEYHVTPQIVERSLSVAPTKPEASVRLHVERRGEPIVTEPISRDDAIIELAAFLGGFEVTRNDARRFLASVPQNPHAVAALAALQARDKKYDEATKMYERALQLAPNDAGIQLDFAESLLGNMIGPFAGTYEVEQDAQPRFRRARDLATAALANGGDVARANAVIGTSYLLEDDVKPGIAALQRARELRPNRYDIALSLYALLMRNGDTAAADQLFADLSSRARTPQAVFASKSAYVREELALVNRLIHDNRIPDAMPILSKLIDATSDPIAKGDLESQMAKLTEIDAVNKQITAYNDAASAANRGEVKKALQMVDKLLQTATDPNVISDATALRRQLQKRVKGMRRS